MPPSGIHPESRFVTHLGGEERGEGDEEGDDDNDEDDEEDGGGVNGGGNGGGGGKEVNAGKLLKKLNFRLGRLQKRIFKLIKESATDFKEEEITIKQAQR